MVTGVHCVTHSPWRAGALNLESCEIFARSKGQGGNLAILGSAVYNYSMRYFLSHSVLSNPVIHGPVPNGREVYVLRSNGTYTSVSYHGYLLKIQSLLIPQSRFVKVKAHSLCATDSIRTCEPIGEGWHLVGLYVSGSRPGAFVLCDERQNPIAKFSPHSMPPSLP